MAIIYVRPTNGNDANDGLSFANAKQTTQAALNIQATADQVALSPEAVELISTGLVVNSGLGNNLQRTGMFVCNTTDGAPDPDGVYTIRATASMTAVISVPGPVGAYSFDNIDFDANNNATNAFLHTSDTQGSFLITRCRFRRATGDGLGLRGSFSVPHRITDSDIHDNGGHGYNPALANRGEAVFSYVRAYNNGSDGFHVNRTNCTFIRCSAYSNTGHGWACDSNSVGTFWQNCVSYGNTLAGIQLFNANSRNNFDLIDTSLVNNGTFGLEYGQPTTAVIRYLHNLHTHGNTTQSDQTIQTSIGSVITGDPLFTDPANGDFVPLAGSPLIGAGFADRAIGVYEPAAGGGAAAILGPNLKGGLL